MKCSFRLGGLTTACSGRAHRAADAGRFAALNISCLSSMTQAPEAGEETLARTYLRQYETKSKEDFWAYERVSDLVRHSPQAGWRITRTLISLAPNDAALAYVAAGPLEDMVKWWGNELREDIEQEARRDRRFLEALSMIRVPEGRGSPHGWWRALLEKYHLY